MKPNTFVLLAMLAATPAFSADVVDDLLERYLNAGAGEFDPDSGAELWVRTINERNCATCHGRDVTQPGRHARTGKPIEPLAPSVNTARLSDAKAIEKWLLRNCQWTFARECSAQEKGDILSWLRSQ